MCKGMNARVFGCLSLMLFAACAGPSTPRTQDDEQVIGQIPPGPTDQDRVEGALAYRMHWRGDVLDVFVQLANPPQTTRFFLPKSWRDEENFSKSIAIAGARGPEGPVFLTIDRQAHHIDVQSQDLPWVELHYVVHPTAERTQLGPAFHDETLVLYGPAFLVLPARQILDRVSNVPIEVLVPKDWSIVSTWPTAVQRPSSVIQDYTMTGFRAEDGSGLRDAFLVAGHLHVTRTESLEVAFDPIFAGDRSQVVRLINSAISFYASELGTLGPTRVFVQSVLPTSHGEIDGLGRKGGFVLRLPENSASSPQVALLVLHEALHLWNGHHLIADHQQEPELRWFIEGLTHYSALMAGCKTGVYGQRFVLDELAAIFDAYLRNPLTSQGTGTTLDQRRFPYDHGALIGFFMEILGQPHQTQALKWISALQDVALHPQRFRKSDVETALRTILGKQESNTIIALTRSNTSVVPVSHLLAQAGLHLLRSSKGSSARLIPLESGPATYKQVLKHCKDDL